ncbi:NAD(P)/FAD-dependent oxidoreductase [Rubrobacter radiotolerans]|nr:FAD-dependent monooxygenase [Rubrobacter radiotolerans]
MAGLLAARVLADHFRRVTIVERDRFPQGPGFRKGVPQSRFPHVLLPGGLAVLRRLFPGIVEELASLGAVRYLWPRDALWLTAGGWSGRFAHEGEDRFGLSQSRELVEWVVRRHVVGLENVRVMEGWEATGLLATADRREVTGVGLRPRPSASAASVAGSEKLYADLVVDASGRNSPAPRWLEALGYEPPEETKIDASLGYAGRTYAIPSDLKADWKIIFIQANPPADGKGGIVLPVEGGRWSVALFGGGGDYPPTDEEGFMAFAKSLRSPVLHEAIRRAEPLTSIHGYRRTANRRRHFERLRRMPGRFLVTGDAACAFNPVYGQGMSVAAGEAEALDRCLQKQWEQRFRSPNGNLAGLARHFQKEVARSHAGAWQIVSGEDLRYPTAEGADRGLPVRLSHRYFDRVVRAAMKDPSANLAFVDVIGLVAPPSSLFRPSVLYHSLRNGGTGRGVEPPGAVQHPEPLREELAG